MADQTIRDAVGDVYDNLRTFQVEFTLTTFSEPAYDDDLGYEVPGDSESHTIHGEIVREGLEGFGEYAGMYVVSAWFSSKSVPNVTRNSIITYDNHKYNVMNIADDGYEANITFTRKQ